MALLLVRSLPLASSTMTTPLIGTVALITGAVAYIVTRDRRRHD
jgi:hypothetical protein